MCRYPGVQAPLNLHDDTGPWARFCTCKTFEVWWIVSPQGGAEYMGVTRPPQIKTPRNPLCKSLLIITRDSARSSPQCVKILLKSCKGLLYYYYAAFHAPCVSDKHDESQARMWERAYCGQNFSCYRCMIDAFDDTFDVTSATRQRWHSRPYPSRSWYSVKRPRRLSKAELA